MRLTGYPMARNLRAKIPPEDVLVIHDRNNEATRTFVDEVGDTGGLEIANSPRQVAEKSVRPPSLTSH